MAALAMCHVREAGGTQHPVATQRQSELVARGLGVGGGGQRRVASSVVRCQCVCLCFEIGVHASASRHRSAASFRKQLCTFENSPIVET